MSITRIVVFGHSHVWSMRRAISELEKRENQPEVVAPLCGTQEMPGPIVYRRADGKFLLTSTLSALLSALLARPDAKTTCLLSMVQGNYYNQLGMVASGGAFDFVLPSHPDLPLDEDAALLPYAAVREMLIETMSEVKDYVRLMKHTPFAARTIMAGPPPPARDDALIRALLSKEKITDPASAPHVRLKLWHLQNQIYTQMCKGTPLTYLPGTPEGTQDAEEFLSAGFVKDAVHANSDWAMRYLRSVFTVAASFKEDVDA